MTPKTLGRYEIVGELGKGAMGVVYLARDPLIGRSLALKTFRLGYAASGAELEQFRARFLREAQSAGILNHPSIVTIHDVVEEASSSIVFIAMEYVEGTDLKKLLRQRGRLPLSFAADIGVQLAEGLDYAHARGVVHRDIKPANIIMTKAGQVKITDFGIARIDASNLTVEGQLLGTPNYMAPEQIQGKEVDHRADLFSLGVLFYEMVTGIKPFAGENLTVVTHRIVNEPFTPPQESIEGLPPGIVAVLDRALRKSPDERYQRASEVAQDLRNLDQAKKAPRPSSVSFLEQADSTLPVEDPAAPEAGAFEGSFAGDRPPAGVPDEDEPVAHQSAAPAQAGSAQTGSAQTGPVALPADRDVDAVPHSTGSSPSLTLPTTATAAHGSSPSLALPTTGTAARGSSASLTLPSVASAASGPLPADSQPHRRRLVIAVALTSVLVLLAATLVFGLFGDGSRDDVAPGPEISWRADYVAGLRLLENGAYPEAIVAFERALATGEATPEVRFARDRAARAQAEEAPDVAGENAGAFVIEIADDEEPAAAIERLLAASNGALAARAYDQVLVLVAQIRQLEPRNRQVQALETAAEEGLARRALATNRLDGAGGANARPLTPPRETPSPTPPPPRPAPVAQPPANATGTLVIVLESQIPEGILTVYRGQERVYRQTFRFEGGGFLGRGGSGGRKEDRIELTPGALSLKVYLWRKGASTRTIELDGQLPAGGEHTLVVRVDASGGLRVGWR